MALPGILTGLILALSRAIGETAPLITIGALTYVPFAPDSIWSPFTVLPIQIFNWVSRPQVAFKENAAAGILVLLALLLTMNAHGHRAARPLPAKGAVMSTGAPSAAARSVEPRARRPARPQPTGAGEDRRRRPELLLRRRSAPSTASRSRSTPTASRRFIGPSGCGKSTFLRTLNRMNDIIPGARVEGTVLIDGHDIYAPGVDVVALRRRVGMVFQKSNPFPKSIFENVAYGLRINGWRGSAAELRGRVEESLQAGGALGRGEGPAAATRRWRCRAASSSGCASRARWPSSPRCC